MVYSTLKHVGGMWGIHCYINIYVHIVGMFEEVSMRMFETEKLKIQFLTFTVCKRILFIL